MAWALISEAVLFAGRRPVLNRQYRLGSGVVADFEIQDHGPTVAVFALTRSGTVVVARQFRPGPVDVLVELPGGLVDPGEEILAAALRELLEETGYQADEARVVGSFPAAGYSTWIRHVIVATGCHRVGPPAPDAEEEIEVLELTLEELRDELRAGRSTEIASAYLAMDALGLLG